MTGRGRIVVDTNVLVSALLSPRSVPRQAFDAARRSGDLLASAATLRELIVTLRKPKLAPFLVPAEREAFLRVLGQSLTVVEPMERLTVCRDPRDNMFLERAVAGVARWLVTGDGDLLTVGSIRQCTILKPAALLAALAEGGT